MARPQKPINEAQVYELAKIRCSYEEMAAVLDCSISTLERRFDGVIKKGWQDAKTSLRRWQYQAAEKGNTAMLIWLGKQLLGQTDKQEIEFEVRPSILVKRDGSKVVFGNSPLKEVTGKVEGE